MDRGVIYSCQFLVQLKRLFYIRSQTIDYFEVKVKNIAAPKIIINFAKSFKIYCGKLRQTSIPKWMSAFFELYRGEILMREANCSYIHSKMNLK